MCLWKWQHEPPAESQFYTALDQIWQVKHLTHEKQYISRLHQNTWTYRKPSFHQIARREESWQDPARLRAVASHYHRARRVVSSLTVSDGIFQRHAVSCDHRRMVGYSMTPIWCGNSLEETFLPHFNLHLQTLQFVTDEHLIFFRGHNLPSPLWRQIGTGVSIGQSHERRGLPVEVDPTVDTQHECSCYQTQRNHIPG